MGDIWFLILIAVISLIYLFGILGLMAYMAHQASKNAPEAVSHIPSQPQLLQQLLALAKTHGYVAKTTSQDHLVFRKGRGWLTSLTELHVHLQTDGSANFKALEGVNFLFKTIYFPINAPTFLSKPIRAHKLKKINLLLQSLNAPNIEFKGNKAKGKIRFKT